MRPGDRRERWHNSHMRGFFFFAALGLFFWVGVDGTAGTVTACWMWALGALELFDRQRGWPTKDGPSPWVRRMIDRDRRAGICDTSPEGFPQEGG
jgi:hypothetical protein